MKLKTIIMEFVHSVLDRLPGSDPWYGPIKKYQYEQELAEEVMEQHITDRDSPNLFSGKKIGDDSLEGEIIGLADDGGLVIKITKLNDEYYERYVELGQSYPLFQHKHWQGDLLLWEVDPKTMNRDVSQLLLQWEKDLGWAWELDF